MRRARAAFHLYRFYICTGRQGSIAPAVYRWARAIWDAYGDLHAAALGWVKFAGRPIKGPHIRHGAPKSVDSACSLSTGLVLIAFDGADSGAGPPPAYWSLTWTTSSPGAWSLVCGFAVGSCPIALSLSLESIFG